jgi:DNA-binding response OmpR family regulator/predicted negative regulator of RcsB-dependent stress response
MAFGGGISSKWVMVIDDLEAMRAQLRMSLSNVGFARLHVVGSIKEALELLANNRYDMILCDYALGDGTDGQQFLEYLRTNDLITRNTAFIMITAEQTYERVVAAAECSPDDYVLKPFTAAQFSARMEKLVEKQEYFSVIDAETDAKNWEQVIKECEKKLVVKDKYFLELSKIKCSALMRSNRQQEAADLYNEILKLRPIGWAKLGLARASLQLGRAAEAKKLTQEIMRETPQFMAAYDFMGKILSTAGEKNEAMLVLQKARTVSPGTMSRVRELSNLAVSAGKPEVAETVMRQALRKHRYSPVRQANDYVMLSNALVKQGKTTEALKVVSDAQGSFKDESSAIILAASESMVHTAAGNAEKAATALAKAMSFGDVSKLPPLTAIAIADACLAAGKNEDATNIMQNVLRAHKGNDAVRNKMQDVLISAGKDAEQAHNLIEETITKDAIELNDMGVRKADAGELDEAADMLIIAADRLTHDLRIVGNAALVIALDLTKNGIRPDKLNKCIQYRDRLRIENPDNPKLGKIEMLLDQLLKK